MKDKKKGGKEREKKGSNSIRTLLCCASSQAIPHLGRRGLAAGNIIIISIVGDEVCVDMMIHPDGIEMSTVG